MYTSPNNTNTIQGANTNEQFDPAEALAEEAEYLAEPASELVPVEKKPTLNFIPPTEVPDLDEMNEGMDIAPKYWEVEDKGAYMRGVLVGWSTLHSQSGKDIPMAVWQNREGIHTSAAANLVMQLQNIAPGTPVQITYNGKEKTGNGFMVKKFTVRLLNPKPLPAMNIGGGVPPMKR
jgi:hypothetical protein